MRNLNFIFHSKYVLLETINFLAIFVSRAVEIYSHLHPFELGIIFRVFHPKTFTFQIFFSEQFQKSTFGYKFFFNGKT